MDQTLRDLQAPESPETPGTSGIRAIFDLVVVEDIRKLWLMHWAPRREQTFGLCGSSSMPSQIDPNSWGCENALASWCESCAEIKKQILR